MNGPSEKSSHTDDLVLETEQSIGNIHPIEKPITKSELELGTEARKADLSNALNDRSPKRMKLPGASRMQKSDMGSDGTEEKACAIAAALSTDRAKPKLDNDLLRLNKGSTGKLKPYAVANKPAGENFKTSTADLSLQKRQNTYETVEIPKRLGVVRICRNVSALNVVLSQLSSVSMKFCHTSQL